MRIVPPFWMNCSRTRELGAPRLEVSFQGAHEHPALGGLTPNELVLPVPKIPAYRFAAGAVPRLRAAFQ
jgi:hypothetical protein